MYICKYGPMEIEDLDSKKIITTFYSINNNNNECNESCKLV